MPVRPSPTGDDRPPQLIDLALQGGGSHGAFTWGVLDRLLEEPWLRIEAHLRYLGGRHERRGAGRRPRQKAGRRARAPRSRPSGGGSPTAARFSPLQRSPLDVLLGRWTLDHSPRLSCLGPHGARLLALRSQSARDQPADRRCWPTRIDFARLATGADQAVHHRDQRAHRARTRVPQRRAVRPTCCSRRPACRPCSRPSRSTAKPYWDGGYSGNPTMTPLVRECVSDDTILVADQSGGAARHPAHGPRDPQSPERSVVQCACC